MAIQILTKAGMSVHGYLRPSPAVSDTDETSVTGTAQKTAVLVDGKPLDQATFDPEQLTEEEPEEDEDEDEPVPRCMLCLSKRKVPTCAECGHVCKRSDVLRFCWINVHCLALKSAGPALLAGHVIRCAVSIFLFFVLHQLMRRSFIEGLSVVPSTCGNVSTPSFAQHLICRHVP